MNEKELKAEKTLECKGKWQNLCRYFSSLKHLRISTKLTLINIAVLSLILVVTNIITAAGIYFSVYHQAEVEMDISMQKTAKVIKETEPKEMPLVPPPLPEKRQSRHKRRGLSRHHSAMDRLHPDGQRENDGASLSNQVPPASEREREKTKSPTDSQISKRPRFIRAVRDRGTIIPGVVLRVINEDGELVYDGSPYFPTLEDVRANISDDKPFWMNSRREVASFDDFFFIYDMEKIKWDGVDYELHFLRTITAEKQFLAMLQKGILLACLLGMAIAVVAGHFASRRALKPIADITAAARKIQVSDLSRRIVQFPVHDELYELTETFNQMLDRIETGFKRERRFVSDASHELRTPITVISGYADMLARWGSSDPAIVKEAIEAIGSEADNMQHLIENLLFLARADMKRQNLNRVPIILEKIIDDVAVKTRLISAEHTVTVRRNDAAVVLADEFMLKELLRIFLENAVKYTPSGGHIEISAERQKDFVTIAVKDDGIGIAPEFQASVFDRFFRIDKARTKSETNGGKSGGIGLGLSIAKEIASLNEMELKLESALNLGTTISATLKCIN